MRYFKMGDGPFYLFYAPYHLPHVQLPLTIARAALFRDATVSPLGQPMCDVVAIAKRDLLKGETLDGIGGFTCFGVIENARVSAEQNLLTMGLAENCRLKRDIARDQALSYRDVELPEDRLVDRLRREQSSRFPGTTSCPVVSSLE